MTQDPLSHVASWLTPTTDVVETVDPIVSTVTSTVRIKLVEGDPIIAMKAELDRLQAEIKQIPDAVIDDAASQALVDRTCDLEAEILKTVAISPAGLIAQIETYRDSGCTFSEDDGFDPLIRGVRNIIKASEPPSPAPLLISSAPVKAREEFGPCLLLTPAERNFPTLWTIGAWDGAGWCDSDGFYIHPTHWAPLPDAP
jgi:hypothetical protein